MSMCPVRITSVIPSDTRTKGAERFSLDDNAPLRRFGDYDVVTLLASSAFREVMCAVDSTPETIAVPDIRMRIEDVVGALTA